MMKSNTIYIIGLITAILLVGCGGGTDSTSTDTTSNATSTSPSSTSQTSTTPTTQCKEITPTLQKLNRKYASSKDDYNSERRIYKGSNDDDDGKDSGDSDDGKDSGDSDGLHNEGRACLSCHSFASAGTVFTKLSATNNTPGATGYKIQLTGGIIYSTARGTGNSRTSSFPTGNYTAQVIDPNGNVVNSSTSNSHDGSRRDCNRCHTSTGNSGAPGRITSRRFSSTTATPTGSTASSCVSFNKNIMPILEAKCKNCHGFNGNFTVTTANATYANISALNGNGAYLLDKGSNKIGHGGGSVISASSAEYTTIKAWIIEGALNN